VLRDPNGGFVTIQGYNFGSMGNIIRVDLVDVGGISRELSEVQVVNMSSNAGLYSLVVQYESSSDIENFVGPSLSVQITRTNNVGTHQEVIESEIGAIVRSSSIDYVISIRTSL